MGRGEARGEYDAFLAHVAALRAGRRPDVLSVHRLGDPRSFMARYAGSTSPTRFPRGQDPRLRPGVRHPARPRHVLPALVARRARHVPRHAHPEPRPCLAHTRPAPVMMYESKAPTAAASSTRTTASIPMTSRRWPSSCADGASVADGPHVAASKAASTGRPRRRVTAGPRLGSAARPEIAVDVTPPVHRPIRSANAVASWGSTRYAESQSVRISGFPDARGHHRYAARQGSMTERESGSGHRLGRPPRRPPG